MVATSSIIKYNSKTVLETALQYAAFGWRVIPLHYPVFDAATGEFSRCSCSAGKDCDKPGKHPRISEWPKNATTDGQIIGEWFGASNKTNIGIAAGKNSDLLVLDVDGQEGVSSVKGRAGLVTPTAKTGNGYHLFFKYPSDLPPETLEIIRRNKVRFLPGLDFRGDGGQVVAAPSRHYSGSYYSWRNPPAADFMPAACPDWLIGALVEAASKTKVGQADASRGKIIQMPGTVKVEASERTAKREKAYCEAALNAACERVKNAVSGTRNDTLFKAVAGVAALLHYGHITEADIYYQFNNAASGAGLKEHETKQTMRSAMDTGRSNPYRLPEQEYETGAAGRTARDTYTSALSGHTFTPTPNPEKVVNVDESDHPGQPPEVNVTISLTPDKTREGGVGISRAALPLPYSIEGEEGVVACLLLDNAAISGVVGLLDQTDFYSFECAALFGAIAALYRKDKPADFITLTTLLKERKLWGDGENQVKTNYLEKLLDVRILPYNLEYYVAIVRKYSALRKLHAEGSIITVDSSNGEREPNELLAEAQLRQHNLAAWLQRGDKQDGFLSHQQAIDFSDLIYSSQAANTQARPMAKFGWAQLDGRTPQDAWDDVEEPAVLLMPDLVVGLLADTGVGKTAAATQIGYSNAEAGGNVLYMHNELASKDLRLRKAAGMSGISFTRLKLAEMGRICLSDAERERLIMASGLMSNWQGSVDFRHCPGWDGQQIADEVRTRNELLRVATGRGYDLIIQDYLMRVAPQPHTVRHLEASQIATNMESLANIANELHVPVIILNQIHRKPTTPDNEYMHPTLRDAYGSGAFEKYSNVILGLWREKEFNGRPSVPAEITLEKVTFGEAGKKLFFQFVGSKYEFI